MCSSTKRSSGTSPGRPAAAGVAIEQFHPEYGANQFETLAGAATPGGRCRPAGADPDHHRPRGPPPRAARQPVPGAVRRQRGIGCPSTLFADHATRSPLFSGGTGAAGHDAGGGGRGGRECSRTAAGAGHPVRVDRVRTADAARQLGRRLRLLGHRKPRSGSAVRHGRARQPATAPTSRSRSSTRRPTRTSPPRRSSGWHSTASKHQAALPPEITVDPATLSDADRDRAGIVRPAHRPGRSDCRTGRFGATAGDSRRSGGRHGGRGPPLEHETLRRSRRRSDWRRSSGWPGACDGSPGADRALAQHIGEVALIDHHVHGYWLTAGDRRRFENALNEANIEPMATSTRASTHNSASRCGPTARRCSGCPKHVEPQAIGNAAASSARPSWPGCSCRPPGVSDWLVDTGIGADDRRTGRDGRAVRRTARTRWFASSRSPSRRRRRRVTTRRRSTRSCTRRAETAVGTKSILAYRGGFDGDLTEPSARRSPRPPAGGATRGGVRLTDRVLLRFGVHEALRLGKPLQFHVGLGDRDCDLHRTNPLPAARLPAAVRRHPDRAVALLSLRT